MSGVQYLRANPLATDLNRILEQTAELWEELRGERIFITGGTGFFGCWLLESFLWANGKLNLNASAVALTRDAARFRARCPHLASHTALTLHEGDIRSFSSPAGSFSCIIHAATAASAELNASAPLTMLDTIIEGTRRVLDFARHCGAKKLLLTSSGAVYGKQPPAMAHMPESYAGMPDTMDPASAYAEGKRVAELLCAVYAKSYGMEAKIARCFAFVGPHLPLDTHFAAGNFVRDQLRGGPIHVKGDGSPARSYLYAGDLAAWLWTILFRGESCRPYNVGSDQSISIRDLAAAVAGIGPAIAVEVAVSPSPAKPADRYVPDVTRAHVELGLEQWLPLGDALIRTSHWAREQGIAEGCV